MSDPVDDKLEWLVALGGGKSNLKNVLAQSVADGVSASPVSTFAPGPDDLVSRPYPADSVFAIPTRPDSSPATTSPPASSKPTAQATPATPATPAAAVPADPALDAAATAWRQARESATAQLHQLGNAILEAFVGEAPALIDDLRKKVGRLDTLAKSFDASLGDTLDKARSIGDAKARGKQLVAAKAIAVKVAGALKANEAFLKQIDANPFGVKTTFAPQLKASLDQLAKVIH